MVWFRENWYEEVLRQLRQALAKCHAVAFDDRSNVAEAAITPHTMSFVRKLVTTFGVGMTNQHSSRIQNILEGSRRSAAQSFPTRTFPSRLLPSGLFPPAIFTARFFPIHIKENM